MVDIASIIIGVISLIIGIIGALYTYKAYRRERELKSVSWNDIQNATKYIWKKLKRCNFSPNIMISPDPKGGIVAFLLSQFYEYEILVDVGQAMLRSSSSKSTYFQDIYTVINTNKWEVILSKQIEKYAYKDKVKILIVDDFVLSGDFNSQLIEALINMGYKRENVMVCCLAVTQVAISSAKAPDLYWKVVDDENFYFPWGKAE